MNLIQKLESAYKKAEKGQFSSQEFTVESLALQKQIEEETTPLLKAGQKNYATIVVELFNALQDLAPTEEKVDKAGKIGNDKKKVG